MSPLHSALTPAASAPLQHRIVTFMRAASIEITTSEHPHLPALREVLPPGTSVYVSHVPSATLAQVVKTALAVQDAGFQATPHIVARRISYPETLRTALADLTAHGVEQVLLVAGDTEHAAGEFESTLDVFASGMLEKSGLKRIGVAGYPEGQRGLGPTLLWNALKAKQSFADRTGLPVFIVTQFGFNGNAIRNWEPELSRNDIRMPILVGIAGPAPLSKLIKFAMRCGIGASLRTVMRNLSAISGIAELATTPEQHVMRLMQLAGTTRVVAPHFFSFGGAIETAHWISRVVAGGFVIGPDELSFRIER
ncbi:MAG TPA: methylenetetrahydrofolate reductase [Steroidobacteraceae bacterium]|jgi:methylenetetrahydrofolate reductase (NADPH)|nr:methylenetetrahydrofolate reductase [Steroidobacteraceae bacterium]